ncbi:MAG: ribbon-helix-helix protein, CopG family [Candidatus Aureabacteria bacterium]|nr:ribbon-helix-helix protein, CopG family [Candidatus Auribacterota bacterium]
MSVAKLAISLDSKMLKKLDKLVAIHIFPNRSKAIQEALEEKLIKIDKSRLAFECAKLNPIEEKQIADEGIDNEAEEWEKY